MINLKKLFKKSEQSTFKQVSNLNNFNAEAEYLKKDRDLIEQELKDKEYFYDLGLKAAKWATQGYVMVDRKYLPENKNCPLVMGHGYKIAEENLKIAEKKWGQSFFRDKEMISNKDRIKLLDKHKPLEVIV